MPARGTIPKGPVPRGPTPFFISPWAIILAGAVLVCAAFAAYQNSFSGPFIFDDLPAIRDNATIRQLWPPFAAWSPPAHSTVSGRPVVNFSLALNRAAGGSQVGGYHATNLAIHLLAGLVLFGVIRRTLLQPILRRRFSDAALPLALVAALLWILHPLQTEAVTYLAQRAESLMSLFFLLTLYAFIRGAAPAADRFAVAGVADPGSGPGSATPATTGKRSAALGAAPAMRQSWFWLAVICCLLGMATKEVMVAAPLLVFFYDRTFVAGTFPEAWRQRKGIHLCLAGTWLLLAWLVWETRSRGGSAGFGLGITSGEYALTQVEAIAHYFYLTVWPHPLVFDYGSSLATPGVALCGSAMVLMGFLAATALALWRWPAAGFVGLWFFAILAPSSSIVPVASQTMAEHRMYLPLAAPVVLIVTGAYVLLGRGSLWVFLGLAAVLGSLTAQRNDDYRSALRIWSDTVAKRPGNPRAQDSLGNALVTAGRVDEATPHFAEAVRLSPADAKLHDNLGNALALLGRAADATAEFQTALRLKPDYAEARYNLALAWDQQGRSAEALAQYQEAVRLKPDYVDAQFNLGCLLAQMGQVNEAIAHFEEAARLRPNDPETLSYLARLRAQGK